MLLTTESTGFLSSILDADVAYNLTLTGFLLIICASILCGIGISATYLYFRKKEYMINDMGIVMVVVPVAAAVVIMIVGRNIAAGLGMSGIFVLVRFRSGPIESKDLSYLFAAICAGVLNGCGYVVYGVLFTILITALIIVLEFAGWGRNAGNPMLLKIWIPESLNFQNTFDPVLKKYSDDFCLLMVRTTDFGSNCELRYRIILKDSANQKKLLDDIRTRNGNMNVVLIVAPQIVERGTKQVL